MSRAPARTVRGRARAEPHPPNGGRRRSYGPPPVRPAPLGSLASPAHLLCADRPVPFPPVRSSAGAALGFGARQQSPPFVVRTTVRPAASAVGVANGFPFAVPCRGLGGAYPLVGEVWVRVVSGWKAQAHLLCGQRSRAKIDEFPLPVVLRMARRRATEARCQSGVTEGCPAPATCRASGLKPGNGGRGGGQGGLRSRSRRTLQWPRKINERLAIS